MTVFDILVFANGILLVVWLASVVWLAYDEWKRWRLQHWCDSKPRTPEPTSTAFFDPQRDEYNAPNFSL